jgi:hypothetical protein
MRIQHVLTILLALAGISLAMTFTLTHPASAAEPACKYTYDEVVKQFADAGQPVFEVPATDLPKIIADLDAATGVAHPGVTRAFLIAANGFLMLGIEVGGCLLDAIPIGQIPAPAADVQSGKSAAGTGA